MESLMSVCFVLIALVPFQCDAALTDCSNPTNVVTAAANDATCANDFSTAASHSTITDVCPPFLDGLECTAALLVSAGEVQDCTDRMEDVLTTDATPVFSALNSAGISFSQDIVDNIGQCYQTSAEGAASAVIGSLIHVFFTVMVVLGYIYAN